MMLSIVLLSWEWDGHQIVCPQHNHLRHHQMLFSIWIHTTTPFPNGESNWQVSRLQWLQAQKRKEATFVPGRPKSLCESSEWFPIIAMIYSVQICGVVWQDRAVCWEYEKVRAIPQQNTVCTNQVHHSAQLVRSPAENVILHEDHSCQLTINQYWVHGCFQMSRKNSWISAGISEWFCS